MLENPARAGFTGSKRIWSISLRAICFESTLGKREKGELVILPT